MGPQRTSPTRSTTRSAGRLTAQYQKMVLRGRHPITTDLDSAPLVSSSAISDTTSSSTNAVFNDNASHCVSTVPAPAKPLVDIQEYPAIPSSWEEYLKRQGGTDKLVEGLESLHATSEHIFKTQKEEIQLRRHQVSVLKEQRRKYQETLYMTKLTQERELRCPGCGNLAWDPQVAICGHTICSRCVDHERQAASTSGRTRRCPKCRVYIYRPPVPSITIRDAIDSIATKMGRVPPSPLS